MPTEDSSAAKPKKKKMRKTLRKMGAKSSDDIDFEDLFGKDTVSWNVMNLLPTVM